MTSEAIDASRFVVSAGALWAFAVTLASLVIAIMGLTWRMSAFKVGIEKDLAHALEMIQTQLSTVINDLNLHRSELTAVKDQVSEQRERLHEVRRDVDVISATQHRSPA